MGKAEDKHPVHGYVRNDVRDKFESARRLLGLTSESAYLTLLVLRELELPQLTAPSGQEAGPRKAKVSAYLPRVIYDRFKAHSDSLGRNLSDCAADLIDKELAQNWFRAALAMPVATP